MAAYVFYRLLLTGGPEPQIIEWTPYDAAGNRIPTGTTGTASASSLFSSFWPASNAFDDNLGTWWEAAHGPPSPEAPEWLQYQFPSAVEIDHFSLTCTTGKGPIHFYLQGSNGGTWDTIFAYHGVQWWADNQVQLFYTTGVIYRLWETAWGPSASGASCIADFKCFNPAGVQLPRSTGTALAGSTNVANPPTLAFDANLCPTYWLSNALPAPDFLAFHFPSYDDIGSFSIMPAQSFANAAPSAWTLQRSTDGENFDNLGDFTFTDWVSCVAVTFIVTGAGPAPTQQPFLWVTT